MSPSSVDVARIASGNAGRPAKTLAEEYQEAKQIGGASDTKPLIMFRLEGHY